VDKLHKNLFAALPPREDGKTIRIKYTWTQKVSGVWPQKSSTLEEVAKRARASAANIRERNWVWSGTQYDSATAAEPAKGQRYSLYFDAKGKLQIFAPCGGMKGKYAYNGRSLSITMNRNLLSSCRKNETIKLFIYDLERGRAAFLEDGKLQITLADSGGVMYFETDGR
jgi:hypothetical protein